jgi:hypothetical protein
LNTNVLLNVPDVATSHHAHSRPIVADSDPHQAPLNIIALNKISWNNMPWNTTA